MRPNTVKRLIAQGEGPKVDFKQAIDLSTKKGQAEFAKDLMSLANTLDAFGKKAYLLLGVADDGSIVGLRSPLSQQKLQQAADRYCQPPVTFSYKEVLVDGRLVGVITIPRSYRKPHKFKREFRDPASGRTIHEHTVFTRHLSHVVVASPEEVVALDQEANLARRKRRRLIALGILLSLSVCLLTACLGGYHALHNPTIQALITRLLPEGIPLLGTGIDPDAAPIRQSDVGVALEKLALLPSFSLQYRYVVSVSGREDQVEETTLTVCGADYHLYQTANFGFLGSRDRAEEYRIGDRVYTYEGGIEPEEWSIEDIEQQRSIITGQLPNVMDIANFYSIGILQDAAIVWGEETSETPDDRFYMLYRKGRIEERLCDIYQARYEYGAGQVSLHSRLSPLAITRATAEEEAWIDQETGALLRYTGRLVFIDEDEVEWEVVVTLRTEKIDQSCPISLEIPENAEFTEW